MSILVWLSFGLNTWHDICYQTIRLGLHQKWPFKMMFLLNLPCVGNSEYFTWHRGSAKTNPICHVHWAIGPLGHWAIGWMPGDHARSSEPPGACALLRASLQGGEVTHVGHMIIWYHMAVPWKSPTLIGEWHHTNIYNHIIVVIVCKVSSETNYLVYCFEIFVL